MTHPMRRAVWMTIACSLALATAAEADPLWSNSNRPLNGRPWVESWTIGPDQTLEKVCQPGNVEPGQVAELSSCLALNKVSLDRVVRLSRRPTLPVFAATPNFDSIRQVGQALTARGVLSAAKDPDAAVTDWLAAIALAQAVTWGARTEGVLIDAMIGQAIQRPPVERLTQLARLGRMTSDLLTFTGPPLIPSRSRGQARTI